MFLALLCSSSPGQNCIIQHLVSSNKHENIHCNTRCGESEIFVPTDGSHLRHIVPNAFLKKYGILLSSRKKHSLLDTFCRMLTFRTKLDWSSFTKSFRIG